MSSSAQEQAQFGTEILGLLERVSERMEPENRDMQEWLAGNVSNPQIIDLFQETTPMMLRVLDAVGQFEPVNGITISKQYHIPKGSVSKATRRLIAAKLITQEALPNNKKEILFRTTPLGKELFTVHRAFDAAMERGFRRFLARYTPDELRLMVRVLEDITEVSFLLELGMPLETPEQ